jgi:periplasmic divalent cation tolerance protein
MILTYSKENPMETRLIYITVADMHEAKLIGRMLVKKRLAACVNLLDAMQSMYWWEGAVQESREVVLIAKTTLRLVSVLIAAVKEIHSYECPCIVSLPIESGNPAFLKWISDETGTPPPPEEQAIP